MAVRWITFDCYGTLVDWNAGFAAILRPMAGERTHELLNAYHRHEPRVQAERPFRSYKDVLTISLARAAAEIGVRIVSELASRHRRARFASCRRRHCLRRCQTFSKVSAQAERLINTPD